MPIPLLLRRLLPALVLFSTVGCEAQNSFVYSPEPPGEYVLVWEENFDARDAAFDERWDIGTHTFEGNEAQFTEENIVVEDGMLKLKLRAEPAGQRQYSGAELRTDNQDGFIRYGRFETRMKPARGSGVISSLFTYRYDPWQEIDIEFKGRDTESMQANIFYNPGPEGSGRNAPFEVPPFPQDIPLPYDAAEEFHVYAFEWEPGVVRWYVDGEMVMESRDAARVPELPQQLMMNLWITDRSWAGPLDASALPTESQYDWVRFYKRENT
jgi:beta-glucanase (GH16 family)